MSSRKQQKRANQLVRQQLAREKRRRVTIWTTVIVVVVVAIAAVVTYGVYSSERQKKLDAQYAMPKGSTKSSLGLPVGHGPVKVDLYVDFMCPNCRDFELKYGAGTALNQYVANNKITLTYHPLNILDQNSNGTEYSTRASAASACASDAGQLQQYVTAMYSHQPEEGSNGLTDSQIISTAKAGGVTSPGFESCVKAKKYVKWVPHVTDQASSVRKVNATPTVFVNGKQIESSVDALNKAITAAH